MLKNKILLVLLLILAMFLAGCQEEPQTDSLIPDSLMVPEQANYETAQVEKKTNNNWYGTTELDPVYPVTDQLFWRVENSRVNKFLVKNGTVDAGTPLMVFDVAENRADLEELRLQLRRKQEETANGKAERETAISAARTDMEGLTSHDLEIAELTLERLQAEYEQFIYQSDREISQIQERIAALEEATENDTLIAPFDGVIQFTSSVKVGEPNIAGISLYFLESRDTYFLKIKNDEIPYNAKLLFFSYEEFQSYQDTDVFLREGKVLFTGTVVTAPDILPGSVRQDAWVKLDGDMTDLSFEELEDMNVIWFYISEEIQDILTVNTNALHSEGEKYYVNILEDGDIKKRYVIYGKGNWIIDGVNEGETLILG